MSVFPATAGIAPSLPLPSPSRSGSQYSGPLHTVRPYDQTWAVASLAPASLYCPDTFTGSAFSTAARCGTSGTPCIQRHHSPGVIAVPRLQLSNGTTKRAPTLETQRGNTSADCRKNELSVPLREEQQQDQPTGILGKLIFPGHFLRLRIRAPMAVTSATSAGNLCGEGRGGEGRGVGSSAWRICVAISKSPVPEIPNIRCYMPTLSDGCS
jgi:hypothetical protein